MLDTNIFNQILDESLALEMPPVGEYFVTLWQENEIRKTSNLERRRRLLIMFKTISLITGTDVAQPKSTPWGSPWGSPWDGGGQYYQRILHAHENLKPKDRGNKADAVIIEICLYESITYVSCDFAAKAVAHQFGVSSLSLKEVLQG
jgi:hypothetical protein